MRSNDNETITSKTVTILVCTKDRPHDLRICLQSLSDFGYFDRADLDVVVVDNNSTTDQPARVCSRYPVQYFSESKRGKSAGLNKGIRESNGKYVVFIDDDVVIGSSEWIDNLLRNLSNGQNVGYVSGNVIAYKTETLAENMWEEKGALSKGSERKEFGAEFYRKFRLRGVPIRFVAVGANCVIPRKVLEDVGGYDELLGPGSLVGGGESLDICYRVLRKGYLAIYDPEAWVYHSHPTEIASLRHKMFHYGVADGAMYTKFLVELGDWRSACEILWGRNLQLAYRLLRSLLGKYPMRPDMLLAGICGNIFGPFKYTIARLRARGQMIWRAS